MKRAMSSKPEECPKCGGDNFDLVVGAVEIAGVKYSPPSFWSCDDCLWTEMTANEIMEYRVDGISGGGKDGEL